GRTGGVVVGTLRHSLRGLRGATRRDRAAGGSRRGFHRARRGSRLAHGGRARARTCGGHGPSRSGGARRMTRTLRGLAVALLLFGAMPALAQSKSPEPDEPEAAKVDLAYAAF